jgi:hypothetical protein
MKRTAQELEAKIVQRYQDGLNVLEVAKELSVGQGTAYRALKRNNITLRNENMPITPENIETIRQMFHQGIGIKTIAKELKTSFHTIRRIMQENGIEFKYGGIGEKSVGWRGGRNINAQGYIEVWLDPKDPMAVMVKYDNYVLEHRLVMARKLGRPLKEYESVHHINGNRQDNRPENLQLRIGKHGNGQVYCCADCGSRNIVQCAIDS